MDKKCWNCGNFDRYYSQGYAGYFKTDKGSCCKQRCTVDRNGTCDLWHKKTYKKYIHRKRISKILNEMLGTLQLIGNFILEQEDVEVAESDYLAVKSGE